jgi:hypothetical protein
VNDTAEALVAELEVDDEQDRDEQLSFIVADHCDRHEYLINEELNIHTLLYSQNACSAFFNGTFPMSRYASGGPFRFPALAADAFEADVIGRVHQLIDS